MDLMGRWMAPATGKGAHARLSTLAWTRAFPTRAAHFGRPPHPVMAGLRHGHPRWPGVLATTWMPGTSPGMTN